MPLRFSNIKNYFLNSSAHGDAGETEEGNQANNDQELDWLDIARERGFANGETAAEPCESREQEGELAVDVWHDAATYYIRSAIAGVKTGDLEITVSSDTVSVAGKRVAEDQPKQNEALAAECHWGAFARTIVLPSEIDPAKVSARLENGILLITAPKLKNEGVFRVPVSGKSSAGRTVEVAQDI